jgi:hypothetical protein
VPLADDRGLVVGGLKHFREGRLRTVEPAVGVVVEAVEVVVLAGQDARPAGAADGVRDQAAVEPDALLADPVDVRGVDELPRVAVGADRLVGVVVGEDQDDVGLLGGRN